jgi:hypothetical protein
MAAPQTDCLIAAGTAVPQGPQFLSGSAVLAIAKALAAQQQKTAVLAIDPALDPALVTRDAVGDIAIFRTSQPVSSLPALSYALGGGRHDRDQHGGHQRGAPRILVLPNQLAAYKLLQTPGLNGVVWLGEDDLAQLGQHILAAPLRFWADSGYVASVAAGLLQQPVTAVAPPHGPTAAGNVLIPQPNCVAVVGARPRDGIALTLVLAEQRRDLRFIVIDWPYLTDTERQHVFARAARCGNIDWRQPDSPATLIGALLEAAVILVPAQQPIGHRDWIVQCQRAGRPLLASNIGALPELIAGGGELLPPGAPAADWLQRLDALRRQPPMPIAEMGNDPLDEIVQRFLQPMS